MSRRLRSTAPPGFGVPAKVERKISWKKQAK